MSDGIEQVFREPEAVLAPAPPPQRVLPQRSASRQRGERDGYEGQPGQQDRPDHVGGVVADAGGDTAQDDERAAEPVAVADPDRQSTSRSASPAIYETVCSPDICLAYVPPDGEEDVYPGFICEVGYSNLTDDAKAKRASSLLSPQGDSLTQDPPGYIRYSSGYVRYVMALNVAYDARHERRGITLYAHQLATTKDIWFPEKCLDGYNVHASA